jgi:hypothetical protein
LKRFTDQDQHGQHIVARSGPTKLVSGENSGRRKKTGHKPNRQAATGAEEMMPEEDRVDRNLQVREAAEALQHGLIECVVIEDEVRDRG